MLKSFFHITHPSKGCTYRASWNSFPPRFRLAFSCLLFLHDSSCLVFLTHSNLLLWVWSQKGIADDSPHLQNDLFPEMVSSVPSSWINLKSPLTIREDLTMTSPCILLLLHNEGSAYTLLVLTNSLFLQGYISLLQESLHSSTSFCTLHN